MEIVRVQCSGCGLIARSSPEPCPRCGISLESARIVSGGAETGTVYSGPARGTGGFAGTYSIEPPSSRISLLKWLSIGVASIVVVVIGTSSLLSLRGSFESRAMREKYRTIFREQPDLVAEVSGYEGHDIRGRYSRQGPKRMIEIPLPRSAIMGTSASGTTNAVVLFDDGPNVTVVFHEFKVFTVMTKDSLRKETKVADVTDPFAIVQKVIQSPGATVEEVGPSTVGDYEVQLVLLNDGRPEPIRVYYSPQFRNAILQLEVPASFTDFGTGRYILSDVSLSPDASLVAVPTHYAMVKR